MKSDIKAGIMSSVWPDWVSVARGSHAVIIIDTPVISLLIYCPWVFLSNFISSAILVMFEDSNMLSID